ncbi:MAG: helix-turn-helix domain-containing protein [Chloroflexota bacterium]
MRTNKEYRKILQLWDAGNNKSKIARQTNIPRGTVRYCIQKFATEQGLDSYLSENNTNTWKTRLINKQFRQTYSYILGIYLGDGYIAKHPRTYRMRIVLDKKYPQIIEEVTHGLQTLVPSNRIQITPKEGAVEVGAYSNDWVEMFPQHGKGAKHERDIILESWQQNIVDEYPIDFIRGLLHSDGTRIEPVVNEAIYSRYEFTNVSDDIRKLFTDTVEQIGLNWTGWGNRITIARRDDVAFLDEHIGPKS